MGWEDQRWEDQHWTGKKRPRRFWNRPVRRPWLILAAAMLALVATKATFGLDVLPALDRFARGQEPPLSLSPAFGGTQVGGKWPGGIVRYFNAAPEHDWALQQAVDAWNGSGAHVRFQPSTEQLAELVITSKDVEQCGHGHATLGWTPHARATVFQPGDGPGCDKFSAARVLAHELGHVIGLDHDDTRCAAMNAKGNRRGAEQCRPAPPWQWRCRLLEESDVLAATKLYDGDPTPARGTGNCSLYEPPQAPLEIRYLPERSSEEQVAFSFVRPDDPVTPTFLTGFVLPAYTFAFVRGACHARPESPRYRWSVAPGTEQVAIFPVLGAGVHCLRVWAADQMGRLSDTASTTRVNVS